MNTEQIKSKIKVNGYSNATRLAKLNARRTAAAARQEIYDALPASVCLQRAYFRRGNSTREITRLRRG